MSNEVTKPALKEIDMTKDIFQFFDIYDRKGNVVTFQSKFLGYVSVPNEGIPDGRHQGGFKNSKLPNRELIKVDYDKREIRWSFESPIRMNSQEGWCKYKHEEEKIFTFPKNGPIKEVGLYKTQRWCSKTYRMVDHYEKLAVPNVFQEHSFIMIVLVDLLGEGASLTKNTYKAYSLADTCPEFKDCDKIFGGNIDNMFTLYLQGQDLNDFYEQNNVRGKKARKLIIDEYNKIVEAKKANKTDYNIIKDVIKSIVGRLMMFKHFSDIIPIDHLNNPETMWPTVKPFEVPWLKRWLKDEAKLKSFIASAYTTNFKEYSENQGYLNDLIRQAREAKIPMSQYSQFNNVKEAHDFVSRLYIRVTNKGCEKEKVMQPERKKEILALKLANKITFEIPKTRADLKGYGQTLNFCIGSYTPTEAKILLAIKKDEILTYCIEVNRRHAGNPEDWYCNQLKAKHNREPSAEDKKIITEGLITGLLNTPKPLPKPKKEKKLKIKEKKKSEV